MRISKDLLYDWCTKSLGTQITDHQNFQSGVSFVNLFFKVFPELEQVHKQVVQGTLVTKKNSQQTEANFSLLKYLMKSAMFPEEIFEFDLLIQNKKKQILGLLSVLYFIHCIRSDIQDPMEFEVSITPQVCEFLQSNMIIKIANSQEEDIDQLLNEINNVSGLNQSVSAVNNNLDISDTSDLLMQSQKQVDDARIQIEQLKSQISPSPKQITKQSIELQQITKQSEPMQQIKQQTIEPVLPSKTIFSPPKSVNLVETSQSPKMIQTLKTDVQREQITQNQNFLNQTVQNENIILKKTIQTEEPKRKTLLKSLSSSRLLQGKQQKVQFQEEKVQFEVQGPIVNQLEQQIKQEYEIIGIIQQEIAEHGLKQQTLDIVFIKLSELITALLKNENNDTLNQISDLIQNANNQLNNLQKVNEHFKVQQEQLSTIQNGLKELGVNTNNKINSVSDLVLNLLQLVFNLSERLTSRTPFIIDEINSKYSDLQHTLINETVIQTEAETIFEQFKHILGEHTKLELTEEAKEVIQECSKCKLNPELIQFLPLHLQQKVESEFEAVTDPDVLRIQIQFNFSRIHILCDIINQLNSRFNLKQADFEKALTQTSRAVTDTQRRCFNLIQELNQSIPDLAQAEAEINRLATQNKFLQQQLEETESELKNEQLQTLNTRTQQQKIKRELYFQNQREELQNKIIQQQNQIIQKLKLDLNTKKEEQELKSLLQQQFEMPTLNLDEPKQSQPKIINTNQQLMNENAELKGQLKGVEKQYELLEQNYLALKRFVEEE
ncbi:Conserved_hypothetical protein [Hexamita inflata]|uniref:Uncharacterized protein n=1 Tax=Hexamita inflata TaxID=28002 RepID=A0AA86P5X9_9EUKA|nr:Conserved hypothetical protein [Hexamita inflata]CAI9943210.1 Conserved hypothetical protein [Hexamita inflata]